MLPSHHPIISSPHMHTSTLAASPLPVPPASEQSAILVVANCYISSSHLRILLFFSSLFVLVSSRLFSFFVELYPRKCVHTIPVSFPSDSRTSLHTSPSSPPLHSTFSLLSLTIRLFVYSSCITSVQFFGPSLSIRNVPYPSVPLSVLSIIVLSYYLSKSL